jgi:hypothetical protein
MTLTARRPALDLDTVAAYIERCQTSDGGFFFARVPPGGAADTYHALAGLRLLGRETARAGAASRWLRESAGALLPGHPTTVFHLAQAGIALGMPRRTLRRWAASLSSWHNDRGGFGSWRRLYVEVPSELEATHHAVVTQLDLDLEVDRESVIRFLLGFQNPDGGFGGEGRSTIASTYYAVATLARLGLESSHLGKAADWLGGRRNDSMVSYIEQLYWLAAGLLAVGRPVPEPERAASFVLACWRPSGGFARAVTGIPTLEHTHYALSVLRATGAIP